MDEKIAKGRKKFEEIKRRRELLLEKKKQREAQNVDPPSSPLAPPGPPPPPPVSSATSNTNITDTSPTHTRTPRNRLPPVPTRYIKTQNMLLTPLNSVNPSLLTGKFYVSRGLETVPVNTPARYSNLLSSEARSLLESSRKSRNTPSVLMSHSVGDIQSLPAPVQDTSRIGQLVRLNRDLKSQLSEAVSSRTRTEREKHVLEEKLRAIERDFVDLQHETDAVRARSRARVDSALGYEKSDLVSRLTVAETTITTLQGEKRTLDELLNAEQRTVEELYVTRNTLQKELEDKDELISSLNTVIRDNKSQLESLKGNVVALSSEQDRQAQQLHAQATRLDTLLHEKNVLQQQLDESERQRKTMLSDYDPLKLENTALLDRKRVDDAHVRRIGQLLDESRLELAREHQLLVQEQEQTTLLKNLLRRVNTVPQTPISSDTPQISKVRMEEVSISSPVQPSWEEAVSVADRVRQHQRAAAEVVRIHPAVSPIQSRIAKRGFFGGIVGWLAGDDEDEWGGGNSLDSEGYVEESVASSNIGLRTHDMVV